MNKLLTFPDKFFATLDKKTSLVERRLDRQADKYISKLEREENRLKRKLYKKDSSLAIGLFDSNRVKYNELKKTFAGRSSSFSKSQAMYCGHLDSLTTALNFLKGQNWRDTEELKRTLGLYTMLQSKLDASDEIRKCVDRRKELLKQEFEKLGMVKELSNYRKEVYYYTRQVKEYKELFENPSKVEARLIAVVSRRLF